MNISIIKVFIQYASLNQSAVLAFSNHNPP